MRLWWTIAFALASLCCSKALPLFEQIERPAFRLELPKWRAEVDEGDAGLGRYKATHGKTAIVEISWQGGQALTLEEMDALLDSIIAGFGLQLIQRGRETLDDQLRAGMVASLNGKVWLVNTLVTCKRTGVMVTIGVTTLDRKFTEKIHQHAIETFRCLGDDPQLFDSFVPPTSTLPHEFGFHREGRGVILAHADGRWIMIVTGPQSTTQEFRKHPAALMGTFGSLLEEDLRPSGEARRMAGLGGSEHWVLRGRQRADDAPVVASLFTCPDRGRGYMLLAMDDAGNATPTALEKLVTAFACPGKGPPIDERPSACEAGVKDFCTP